MKLRPVLAGSAVALGARALMPRVLLAKFSGVAGGATEKARRD